MDKEFWTEIYKNKFEIPAGYGPAGLTRELFSYLGSSDPELRDDIGYTVYANWLKQERYSVDDIRGHIRELLANLEKGIGETESNTVFLRAFSILFLAEIVHNDNKRNFLEKPDIQNIFEKGTAYIRAENDPRGYIPVKGWAHALAHSADLMLVLAKNRHIEAEQLSKILNVIAEKIIGSTNYVYIHGEDERLAGAVIEVLRREMLSTAEVKNWALHFIKQDWKGAYTYEGKNRAFQNTRNLLRSVYLELKNDEGEIPRHDDYEMILLEVLRNLKPY
jgi:hypothetical protein